MENTPGAVVIAPKAGIANAYHPDERDAILEVHLDLAHRVVAPVFQLHGCAKSARGHKVSATNTSLPQPTPTLEAPAG